jgi:integrase
MKAVPEWLKAWRANPRRWDNTALMALPVGARVFERGIGVRRTDTGLSWWIYYRAPVSPGAKRKKPKQELVEACRNKTMAEGVLASVKARIFQGTYQPRVAEQDITLGELAKVFFVANRHLATVDKYEEHWVNHVEPFFKAGTSARAVTRERAEAFYAKKLDEGCAVASANYYFATLRAMLSLALERGFIDKHPCAGVKLKKANNHRERMLTEDEAARLLVAARQRVDLLRPLFVLLHDTGMRLGEALRLAWADVRIEERAVRVRDPKNDEGRWVHLAADTAAELARWKAQLETKTRRRRNPRPMAPWVFPGRQKRDGTWSHVTEIKKGWAAMCEAAGVEVGRHELRHNFISHALAAGHSPADIMPGTGHKTIRAFEGYAHTQADRRRAVAESVASKKRLRSVCAENDSADTSKTKRASG